MLRASRLVWMLVEKVTAAETPKGKGQHCPGDAQESRLPTSGLVQPPARRAVDCLPSSPAKLTPCQGECYFYLVTM